MSASAIHSAACMQTVLVACLLLSFVHGLHALPLEVQAAAADATGEHSKQVGARSAPKSVSRSTPLTPHHTPIPTTETVTSIESEDVQWPVEPFVVDGAVVTGVADPEDQAALRLSLTALAEADASVSMQLEGWWPRDWSDASAGRGAARRLLHGHRKPWKYATCNRCTIVRCNSRACSGHCRKNRRLFICSSPRFFAAPCVPLVAEDLSLLPVDPLDAGVSVVVTAPAPYIGCVEIANKPTGCPERFTRGTTADGRSVDVLESTCMSERYLPDCSSPLFPFGICECRVRVTGSGTETRACDITELSAGLPLPMGRTPPPGRTSGDSVVELRGDMTYTEFVDYIEEDQSPNHMYSRSVSVDGGDVNVRLEIFRQDTVNVAPGPASGDSYVREESDFGEEYNDYLQSTLPSDYLPVQPPPPVEPDYDYVQPTPNPSAGDPEPYYGDPEPYYGDPEPYYGDAGYQYVNTS